MVLSGSAEPLPLGRRAPLRGRASELTALARLVEAVLAGQSRVLVIRGEPGAGKTALLDYLAGQAPGCRVVRALGVQSEMELAFAGLHQLCVPMLTRIDGLPEPQREALRTAFGLSAGPVPDRFLVGLAVLSLLSEEAGEQPLLCLVDDHQWLDSASAQALGFVARRLAADPVGLVLAARDPVAELAGLPELTVEGLPDGDARALLDSALACPLDARVRDQIVAETRGNPLALLELPRGLTPAQLAGGFGLAGVVRYPGGSRRASCDGCRPCRPRRCGSCSWPRRIRPATWRSYGGRPDGSASQCRQARPRSRPSWPNSARGYGSGIPWCARRPTGRRPCRTGERCTACWRRSPIRGSIPTAAPGTGRRPRQAPMRRSPASWSARPGARRPAGASRRRPRSWNARRC